MAVKICPECGGKVAGTRNDCIHCGYVFLLPKKCPECEENVDMAVKECPVCGYVFDNIKISEEVINDINEVKIEKDDNVINQLVKDVIKGMWYRSYYGNDHTLDMKGLKKKSQYLLTHDEKRLLEYHRRLGVVDDALKRAFKINELTDCYPHAREKNVAGNRYIYTLDIAAPSYVEEKQPNISLFELETFFTQIERNKTSSSKEKSLEEVGYAKINFTSHFYEFVKKFIFALDKVGYICENYGKASIKEKYNIIFSGFEFDSNKLYNGEINSTKPRIWYRSSNIKNYILNFQFESAITISGDVFLFRDKKEEFIKEGFKKYFGYNLIDKNEIEKTIDLYPTSSEFNSWLSEKLKSIVIGNEGKLSNALIDPNYLLTTENPIFKENIKKLDGNDGNIIEHLKTLLEINVITQEEYEKYNPCKNEVYKISDDIKNSESKIKELSRKEVEPKKTFQSKISKINLILNILALSTFIVGTVFLVGFGYYRTNDGFVNTFIKVAFTGSIWCQIPIISASILLIMLSVQLYLDISKNNNKKVIIFVDLLTIIFNIVALLFGFLSLANIPYTSVNIPLAPILLFSILLSVCCLFKLCHLVITIIFKKNIEKTDGIIVKDRKKLALIVSMLIICLVIGGTVLKETSPFSNNEFKISYVSGGVKIEGYAGNGTDVVVPDTYLGYDVIAIDRDAFIGCSSLTSIVIPEGVTSIGYNAFSGCSSLTSIKLPSTLTSIELKAFSGCSSLTSIVIPEGVTSIDGDVFDNCSSLTIYCEASSKPSGWYGNWISDWNYYDIPVYWAGQWEYDANGNPVPLS